MHCRPQLTQELHERQDGFLFIESLQPINRAAQIVISVGWEIIDPLVSANNTQAPGYVSAMSVCLLLKSLVDSFE